MELLKLWDIVVRRKTIFLVTFLTVVLVPVIGSFLIRPVYKCSAKVWIKYKSVTPSMVVPSLPSELGKFSYSSSDYVADTFVALIESRPVVTKVIKDLDLKDRNGNLFDISAFVEPGYIKKLFTQKTGLEAVQIEDSELFEIKAYSTDLEKGSGIANAVSREFLDLFYNVNSTDVESSLKILEGQADRVRRDWNEAERQRLEYRTNKMFIDMDKQKTDLLSSMTTLQDQKRGNDVTIEADRAAMSTVEKAIKREPEFKPAEDNTGIENLGSLSSYKSKLYDLELSLAEKQTQVKEAHPSIPSLRAQIDLTKKAIQSTLSKSVSVDSIARTSYFDSLVQKYGDAMIDITTLSAKNAAIDGQTRKLEKTLQALLQTEYAYLSITQRADTLKAVLNGLNQQLEYSKIAQAIKTTNATIVESSAVPSKANEKKYIYFPNKKLILAISLFLGTVLAFCVVLFLDFTDDTFRTRGEVEKDLKLPVLAAIPDNIK